MKFAFYWFENQEMIDASPSFKREVKRFLTPLFKETIYKYFDKDLLSLQNEGLPALQDDNSTMKWDEVRIYLSGIPGLLFTFQLLYKHQEEVIVQPYDTIKKGSLSFQVNNFPTDEELFAIQDSWSEVVKSLVNSRIVDKKFRFSFQEKPTCMPPDVSLRIKTSVEGKVLESMLGESMSEWNERAEKSISEYSGLIHNLWFDKVIRDEKIIAIDLGSSSQEGLLYLLEELEKSDLEIQRIILE